MNEKWRDYKQIHRQTVGSGGVPVVGGTNVDATKIDMMFPGVAGCPKDPVRLGPALMSRKA